MPVFLFVPLPPFFYAAIAKRLKVQLSNGLRKINLTSLIKKKRHILTRTTMLYNENQQLTIMKKKKTLLTTCREQKSTRREGGGVNFKNWIA